MPNSPSARRSGSTLPAATVSSNKIVRGQVLTAKLTAAANPTPLPVSTKTSGGGAGTGTVTSITAGTGLSGGVITTAGTISMPNTGTAGTTGDSTHVAQVTTDAQGRVTAASAVAISFPTSLPPNGAAGGRLTGTYPNPTLAASGVAAGTYYRPKLIISADGTISSAVTDTEWFNVKDYGAKGDNSTDDQSAINTAAAAAATAQGTLFFPDGIYVISAAISFALVGKMTIRGTGRFSSVIRAKTAGINGITADLSGGVLKADNRLEVCDLGFTTTATTACGTAVSISYGAANIASSENRGGCVVTRLEIGNFSATDTSAGWVFGIVMTNCWHAFVTDIYGYGNATTWNAGATPGAGASGAASGAMITFLSGTNYTIANIQGDFWSQGIRLAPVSASTAGQNQICQGVLINTVNFVQANEGIHCYTNTSFTVCDVLSIVNFQVDNGNASGISNLRGIFVEYGVNVYISTGLVLQDGGSNAIELSNCSGSFMTNVNVSNSNSHNPATALTLSGASNGNRITACIWNTLPITLGASAGNNYVNNTSGSTVTDSGLGNVVGDPRRFPFVITPTATASYSFTVNISLAGLANAPDGAPADIITSLPNDMVCKFDYSHAGNTATSINMLLSRSGGGTLTAAAIRGCCYITP